MRVQRDQACAYITTTPLANHTSLTFRQDLKALQMIVKVPMPPRQNGSLDVKMLCSKLESHQRQQEAARVRRERRNGHQKGIYVPRSAAAQFTVTTTPAAAAAPPRNFVPQRRSSLPVVHSTSKELGSLDKKAATVEQPKVDPSDVDNVGSAQTHPQRIPNSSSQKPGEQIEIAEERPRGYSSGTAAERRTAIEFDVEPSSKIQQQRPRRPTSCHPGMLEAPPNRCAPKAADGGRRKSETTIAEGQRIEARQNMAMYNRPDWAQQSQNGDGATNLLHLPRTGHRESGRNQQQEHHLVADAVKLIHEEQRTMRRKSILGFFKMR